MIRKNKALASAIQKLIEENGYAEFYVYCTLGSDGLVWDNDGKGLVNAKLFPYSKGSPEHNRLLNGKVIFKFRCYKVEEIGMWNYSEYGTPTLMEDSLCLYSCLNFLELKDYIKDKPSTAIHISDLEIFDKPKELSEFYKVGYSEEKYAIESHIADIEGCDGGVNEDYINNLYEELDKQYQLTKAPQNYCYVEVE